MRELDNLRHEVTGKILLPVEWSPLQEVDLTTVPTDGATHPRVCSWRTPAGLMPRWTTTSARWDEIYYRVLSKAPPGRRVLEIQACFQVAQGATNAERRCCGRD